MQAVPVKTTRYGLSLRMQGGWDEDGDGGTDKFLGCFGDNILNRSSCALTVSAEDALARAVFRSLHSPGTPEPGGRLHLPPHQEIALAYPDPRFNRRVTFDDRAPEGDSRVDIFLPYHDDPEIPDFAQATVILTR